MRVTAKLRSATLMAPMGPRLGHYPPYGNRTPNKVWEQYSNAVVWLKQSTVSLDETITRELPTVWNQQVKKNPYNLVALINTPM